LRTETAADGSFTSGTFPGAVAACTAVLPRPTGDRQRLHRPAEERGAVEDGMGLDLTAPQREGVGALQGKHLDAEAAIAYARRPRGERKRPSHGWEALTPTELDVARLAADGLTNPAIGERLFISRGTVKTHLEHVYAKVGVRNRPALAAAAARRSPSSTGG
jgi:DNA-binding CsgD family transcriptional regulator